MILYYIGVRRAGEALTYFQPSSVPQPLQEMSATTCMPVMSRRSSGLPAVTLTQRSNRKARPPCPWKHCKTFLWNTRQGGKGRGTAGGGYSHSACLTVTVTPLTARPKGDGVPFPQWRGGLRDVDGQGGGDGPVNSDA